MTSEEIKAALDQIWECIYDHGNGKTEGALSKFQRVLAFKALAALREHLATDAQERNFCPRCGKRAYDGIHTCTPPKETP